VDISRPHTFAWLFAFLLALAPPLLTPEQATAQGVGAWTPMASAGAPDSRDTPATVWTGNELVLWGGTGGDALKFLPIGSGGRYNPVTRTWRPMAAGGPVTIGAPSAVWTDTDVIIWSGQSWWGSPEGAIYHPITNNWTPLPTAGQPGMAESQQAVVWTGKEMIVWAGEGGKDVVGDGAMYVRDTDSWQPLPAYNVTAFTDGYRTWVNGPFGIEERLNSQRFPWEAGSGAPGGGAHRYDSHNRG